MAEMLAMLAIVAVLSVVSLAFFQFLKNKYKANIILHDSRIVWVNARSNQSEAEIQWQGVPGSFESGKTFQMMRDKKGNDYIQVKDVEKAVCKHILNMVVPKVLTLLNDDYTPMTTCGESNNIVIAMDGLGKPAECITRMDCEENFEGICNPEGHCQVCDESSERLNEEGTACECDPNKSLICTDDNKNEWCCGSGLICDIPNKSCKDGGGACMYTFSQQEQKVAANCHYTINADNKGNIIMTEDPDAKCSSDEYCYVAYFDKDCSLPINRGNVGNGQSEEVWGSCLLRTSNNSACSVSMITSGGLFETQGCPAGEYCYIKWEGNNCLTEINRGDITGPMLGACMNRTSNTIDQCPIQD